MRPSLDRDKCVIRPDIRLRNLTWNIICKYRQTITFSYYPRSLFSIMKKSTKISFNQVDDALRRANAEADTAEAHGMLCGMICATGRGDINSWIPQIIGDRDPRDVLVKESHKLLMDLHDQTFEQITDGNFALKLLLPSDDTSLDQRILDLGEWCQGFLFGMSLSNLSDPKKLPDEAGEVLADMVDISKTGYDAGDDDEENEAAYNEIVEYIRIGVLVIYNELNGHLHSAEGQILH